MHFGDLSVSCYNLETFFSHMSTTFSRHRIQFLCRGELKTHSTCLIRSLGTLYRVQKDHYGDAALHTAAQGGSLDILKYFIDFIDERNWGGGVWTHILNYFSPLYCRIVIKDISIKASKKLS